MKQKLTTINIIIYNHSTHTKLRHLACSKSKWKFSNPSFLNPPD